MSIPLFFSGWQFSNNNPDDHIYVDGGVIYNYPVRAFDSGTTPNPETLGFFLTNLGPTPPPSNIGYNELLQYVRTVFDTIMDAQNINYFQDPEDEKRTVNIDNLGISATDFGLTQAQQQALYQSGVKYATGFLKAAVPAA
jgi:NTE family protein